MTRQQVTGALSRDWRAVAARPMSWIAGNKIDLGILLAITVAAAVPRLVLLGDVPPGLHGDEAVAGIEARRALDGINIAPYSFRALGVPSGTFHWTAAVFAVLGESIFTLRLSFAVLGIATVAVSYLAFRVMFTRPIAVIGASLLAVSAWHLHYSRIAFIPIGWPLLEMATLLFFFLAVRHQSRILFGLAGAALGAGVYTYQAFPVFAVALGLAVVWIAVTECRRDLFRYTAWIATMFGVALLVGLPMASFARDHPDIYLGRFRDYSVTRTAEYKEANGPLGKADVLLDRELDYIRSVISRPVPDGVDAGGFFPLVDRVSLGLLIVGSGIALWRFRKSPYATVLILTVIIGVGPALAQEGWYRRTLGITPLMAAIAALPLALVWEEAWKRGRWPAVAAGLAVIAVVGSVAGINLSRYFSTYNDGPQKFWVFNSELVAASNFMDGLPEDTLVYFFSRRYAFDYETRVFLAPKVDIEARGGFSDTAFRLGPDPTRNVAYVFLDQYLDRIDEVVTQHPGGEPIDGGRSYQAYLLPRSEEPPPTPTPAPPGEAGRQRDGVRHSDLEIVSRLALGYLEETGSLPNTGRQIQSLCVFRELDAGCALANDSLLPADPLGDPGVNGYFYSSDGSSFVVYAQRESDAFPACPDHPEFLGNFESVLCVSGP